MKTIYALIRREFFAPFKDNTCSDTLIACFQDRRTAITMIQVLHPDAIIDTSYAPEIPYIVYPKDEPDVAFLVIQKNLYI